jgi:hypothetical protein
MKENEMTLGRLKDLVTLISGSGVSDETEVVFATDKWNDDTNLPIANAFFQNMGGNRPIKLYAEADGDPEDDFAAHEYKP